jgi:hypothetical protein
MQNSRSSNAFCPRCCQRTTNVNYFAQSSQNLYHFKKLKIANAEKSIA